MLVEKRASTLEDNLNVFVSESRKRMDAYDKRFNSLEIHCTNMGASIKALETQIGQLIMAVKEQATRSFSNDAENNVRECKAITVKSGTEVQTIMERNGGTNALMKARRRQLDSE